MKIIGYLFLINLVGCISKVPLNEKKYQIESVQDGILFKTYVQIAPAAIERAKYIVRQMLKNSPEIAKLMATKKFSVEIIGRHQNTTDLPRYYYLKNQKTLDGRNYDSGTRGLGDSNACSVAEENLLCLAEQKYSKENILIHEFAHSVKYNMPAVISAQIDQAFLNAKQKNIYPKDIYMMANSQEYWAEATQSWFGATVRVDVNAGVNSRAMILKHDPEMANILRLVYGDVEIDHSVGCRF